MVQPVGLVFLDSKLVVGWGSSILLGRSDKGLVPQTQRSVGAQGAISLNQYTFMRLCYVEKTHQKSIALAVSAALAASLSGSPLAQAGTATENSSLLGASTLDSGYMQFAKARRDSEGKCGEGKCGGA
ncbi:hypothetical protein N9W42_06105 [Pseudomonadales bacterium]|nr:hypothetical protein [Pseudomonadales bacterium]